MDVAKHLRLGGGGGGAVIGIYMKILTSMLKRLSLVLIIVTL
jgi:hypothetical protein